MALPYESYNIDEVGAKKIPQLEDVILNNLADGEVLTYNSSTEKWENSVIISGAGTLDGLTDTDISSVADMQVLAYNSTSSKWENTTLIDIDSLSNLSDTNINALADAQFLRYDANVSNKWINTDLNLEGIKDVNITGIANTEVLKYDNGNWVNSTILVNELQDVNITNLQNNEVLKYNSSSGKWENQDNTDTLNELNDTNITSLDNNNILKYNSSTSKWENTFINFDEIQDVNLHTLTDGAIIKYNSTNTEWETSSLSLNELNNVNTTGVADTNVLKYDSTTSQFLTGAVLLNEVFDVTITNPLNNQFLAYNTALSKWVNTSYIDIDTISNLSDTNISSLANKDLLVYDDSSSKWINDKINLNDLNDVNTSEVANTNVLKYDSTSSNWFPSFIQLNELLDTNISSPGATEVLKYTGSQWVNQPVNINEINGIDLTLLVNNELLRKDGANNSVVGADIITSTTTGGGVISQKTKFVEAGGVLFAPLSSIESKNDSGTYSMTLNPNDANANQTGKFVLVSNNNNTRVGINVDNPTEDFEIDGNIQLDSNNQSRIIFYDTQNDHEHAEIDALGKGTDGGQLIFYTKADGGSVTEKMRITDDGGVGIGTVSPTAKLDVNGNLKINDKIYGTGDTIELYTNTTAVNSYSWTEMRADKYAIGGPRIDMRTNSTNTSIGDVAMTILSNGNAGIGTFSPTEKLEVDGTFSCSSDATIRNGFINDHFQGGDFVLSHKNQSNRNTSYGLFLHNSVGQTVLNSPPGSYTALANGGSYRLRVYTDHIRMGTRDFGYLNNVAVSVDAVDLGGTDAVGYCTSSDGNWILVFYNSARNNSKGKIRGTGGSNGVAYDTTSDRRLKENITPMPSMLEKIKQLEPVYYTWREDGKKGDGFIAQDVHKVFPQLRDYNCWDKCKCGMTFNDAWDGKTCMCEECDVENPKNTVGNDYTFGLDYGKFTPYIIKAMQEQQEIIERQEKLIQSLVTRIEALEKI